jgi:hypothetical protein
MLHIAFLHMASINSAQDGFGRRHDDVTVMVASASAEPSK